MGEVDRIERGPVGLRVNLTSREGEVSTLDVSGVVAATGFQKSPLTIPLLRRLVDDYRIPLHNGRVQLQTNCGMPGLDRPESRLCVMGIHANDVIPHGDTIAGLKYIARRFVADCARAERLKPRSFPSRLRLQLRLSGAAASEMKRLRPTEQLA